MPTEPRPSHVRAAFAALLVSLGVLVIEISLTRILSFTLWYHFTYVTIGIALLGYGASGAFLSSSRRLERIPPPRVISGACLFGVCTVVLTLLVIRFMPFRPLEVTSDPVQFLIMSAYLLTVALPFFAGGLVIAAALRHWTDHTTTIYFADLLGAGSGCALAVPAIWLFGAPGSVVAGSACIAAAGLLMQPRRRPAALAVSAAAVVLAGAIAGLAEYRPSADKPLARFMERGVTTLYSRWSPIFRVDVYEALTIQKRRGTSQKYEGYLPPARFVAHDGTAEAAMYRFEGRMEELEFFDWNVASAPYRVLDAPDVLIIGLGGGFDLLAGIHGKARSITGIELDPVTIDIVSNHSRDFAGAIFQRPEVKTIVAEGRSFLRHSAARYDLIQLTAVDTLAALSSGAYVLAESYLYTVEAMKDYLAHLTDDGILSFMIGDYHWRTKRSRFALRHIANFYTAAREMGWSDPAAHVMAIGSREGFPMIELMFRKRPFTSDEIALLSSFARSRDFDLWAVPGATTGSPLDILLTGTAEEREGFLRGYALEVRETRDDRPFFFHFFRWSDLLRVGSREIDLGHTGATGQLILGVLLLFTILATFVLIFAPLLISRRIALGTPGSLRFAGYFAGVGLGFMLLEISLIQRFVLFLGHPTYAIATTLAALLVSTGLGSFLSGKLPVQPRRMLLPGLFLLAAITIGYVVVLPGLFERLLGNPLAVRVAVAIAILFPLGLLLGIFFPSGLRIVRAHHPDLIPWAWGVNGGASVVGSILAIFLAITFGFPVVTIASLGLYAAGIALLLSVTPAGASPKRVG